MESNAESYVLVDANIWIAYFDKQDALSKKAKDYIQYLEDNQQQTLVTDFVLQEVTTILLYKNKTQQVQQFINYIQTQPHIDLVRIDAEFWDKTMVYVQSKHYKPKLSFTDWSLLFLSDVFEFNLLTFDKQLANSSKRLAIS